MSKAVKNLMIASIQKRIGDTRDLLVVDASKVDAISSNKWRNALRRKNISALGVKNAVAKKALRDVGLSAVEPYLTGAATLIWGGEDVVALAKQIVEDTETLKNLEIRGGVLGDTGLNPDGVKSLSKSPGRKELLSIIAGMILSPGGRLVAALNGPGGKLSGQVKTLADKEDSGS